MPYDDYENEGSLAQKTFLKEPDDYKVILLNDDFTTMEFVVQVLQSVFHLGAEEAEKVMMSVHKTGSGVAGIYTYDIASTRAQIPVRMARQQGFPLRCEIQKA